VPAGVSDRDQATIFMPKALARMIVSWPIWPTPITASVLPKSPRATPNCCLSTTRIRMVLQMTRGSNVCFGSYRDAHRNRKGASAAGFHFLHAVFRFFHTCRR
jgi:hypothetical protein